MVPYCLILLLCISSTLFAKIPDTIHRVLSTPRYHHVETSIAVYQLSPFRKPKPIILYKENQPLIPASTIKLLTAAATLTQFSPYTQFKTPVYLSKTNDMIIEGRGDPNLRTIDLQPIITALKKKKIATINTIIVDTNYFPPQPLYKPSSAQYYYAPASALNINYNEVLVTFNIAENKFKTVDPTSYIQIETTISTKNEPLTSYITTSNKNETIFISGSLPNPLNTPYKFRINHPEKYAQSNIFNLCYQNNIYPNRIYAQISKNTKKKHLTTLKSKPLKEAIKLLLTDSNNMIAQVLGLHLQKRNNSLQQFATQKLKWSSDQFYLDDTSGLSKKNRVTAKQLSTLLSQIQKKRRLKKHILPYLNKQGSHPKLLNYTPPERFQVHIKTGTLAYSGINSIAGYIFDTQTNKTYSIVILCNRTKPGTFTGTNALIDPLLNEIIQILTTG